MTYAVDRETASVVMAEMNAAIDAVLARHEMKRVPASYRYGDSLSVKVTAVRLTIDPETGVNMTDPGVAQYELYARSYGLPPDGVGKQFTYRGELYTVAGFNRDASRYPVKAIRTDGKQYKFDAKTVAAALGNA